MSVTILCLSGKASQVFRTLALIARYMGEIKLGDLATLRQAQGERMGDARGEPACGLNRSPVGKPVEPQAQDKAELPFKRSNGLSLGA